MISIRSPLLKELFTNLEGKGDPGNLLQVSWIPHVKSVNSPFKQHKSQKNQQRKRKDFLKCDR